MIKCITGKHDRNTTYGDSESTHSSTTISLKGISDLVELLKTKRHRNGTQKNYYCVWRKFSEFFIRLDNKPEQWEDRITLFVGFLIQNGKKSTTIRSYVSAMKSILWDLEVELTEDRLLLSALTCACKIQNDIFQLKIPIERNYMVISWTVAKNIS